jgi:ABC-type multidrug transport system fused ATPase/permease subunit
MDHGKVSEMGTHDELVANNGIYAGLWNLQTGQTYST